MSASVEKTINFFSRHVSSSQRKWASPKWFWEICNFQTVKNLPNKKEWAWQVIQEPNLQVIIVLVVVIFSRIQPAIDGCWMHVVSHKLREKQVSFWKFILPLAYVASIMFSWHVEVNFIITIKRSMTEIAERMSRKPTSFIFTTINFWITISYMLS